MDIELIEKRPIASLKAVLSAQLPSELEIVNITELALDAPSATKALVAADYRLEIESRQVEGTHPREAHSFVDWEGAIAAILSQQEIWLDKVSKSGKAYRVNGRELLYQLSLEHGEENRATLSYRGCCRNDGTMLRPEQVVVMLGQYLPKSLDVQLRFVERQQLIFHS